MQIIRPLHHAGLLISLSLIIATSTADAKVSVGDVVCFALGAQVEESGTSPTLMKLAERAISLEREYGHGPDALVIVTTLPSQAAETEIQIARRNSEILKLFRAKGVSYTEAGEMNGLTSNFSFTGCKSGQAAVEVEILFPHMF